MSNEALKPNGPENSDIEQAQRYSDLLKKKLTALGHDLNTEGTFIPLKEVTEISEKIKIPDGVIESYPMFVLLSSKLKVQDWPGQLVARYIEEGQDRTGYQIFRYEKPNEGQFGPRSNRMGY